MITDNFKQLADYFEQTTKMMCAISHNPKALEECEDSVYEEETKQAEDELRTIVKEFRNKYPKTFKDKLQILRWRLN